MTGFHGPDAILISQPKGVKETAQTLLPACIAIVTKEACVYIHYTGHAAGTWSCMDGQLNDAHIAVNCIRRTKKT